jgi:hypothetical protein
MRMSFSSLVVGAAIGYVLGARAGRGRYEQLVKAGEVTVTVSRALYRAGETGVRIGERAFERMREARGEAAAREQLDWELEAALASDQPFNGHVRVT